MPCTVAELLDSCFKTSVEQPRLARRQAFPAQGHPPSHQLSSTRQASCPAKASFRASEHPCIGRPDQTEIWPSSDLVYSTLQQSCLMLCFTYLQVCFSTFLHSTATLSACRPIFSIAKRALDDFTQGCRPTLLSVQVVEAERPTVCRLSRPKRSFSTLLTASPPIRVHLD